MKWQDPQATSPVMKFILFTSDKNQYRRPTVVWICGVVETTHKGDPVDLIAKSSTRQIPYQVYLNGNGSVADFNAPLYMDENDPIGKYEVTASIKQTDGSYLNASLTFEVIS